MKKRIIALLLAIVTVCSSISVVFAENSVTTKYEENPKDIYESLSDSERAKFDYVIATNENLLIYHKENVDADFDGQKIKKGHAITSISLQVSREFSKDWHSGDASINSSRVEDRTFDGGYIYLCSAIGSMGLVSAVEYSFEALSCKLDDLISSIGSALTASRIKSAMTSVKLVATLVANYNSTTSKWTKIVNAFVAAYPSSASAIKSAFSNLQSQVKSGLAVNPCVTVSGDTLTYNGTKYKCTKSAQELSLDKPSDWPGYYPAVIYKDAVFFAPIDIGFGAAKAIMAANAQRSGVITYTDSKARACCGNNPVLHMSHKSGEGYYYHYHVQGHTENGAAHAWFIL